MKFSIAIPAYKPYYLRKAIQSIIGQTFQNWELIILNDDSPYDLDTIINEFSDNRIRYYKNDKNIGAIDVVDNWNKCLELAIGEYIMVIGDDDFLNPNNLEVFNQLILKYPDLYIYHGRTILVDPNDKPVFLQDARPEYESVFSAIWEKLAGSRQQFIGDYLFKTSFLRGNGGFYKLPLAWGSDEVTVFKSISNKGIANSNIPIFNYRINPYSITSSGNAYVKMNAMEIYMDWLTSFVKDLEPNNITDKILKDLIIKKIKNNFIKRKIHIISVDVSSKSFIHTIKWFWKYKLYNLPFQALCYAYIESFKLKRSKKNGN